MNQREIEEYFLNAIDVMVQERFKELARFNYYIEATVISVNDDETCDIDYNENLLSKVKFRSDLTLQVGDIVLVCIVNGNFSNKFIDLKRP